MKQCLFLDLTNDVVHGGIIDDEGNIICGCCGGLIHHDEICCKFETEYRYVSSVDECTCRLIEISDTWIDLDDEIREAFDM